MADEQLPEGTDTIIEDAGIDAPKSGDPGFTAVTGAPLGGDATPEREPVAAPAGAKPADGERTPDVEGAKGAWFDRIDGLKAQGYDSARAYAASGKDRAVTAIDDLVRMVNDAAGQIDDKIGGGYGDYARRAADSLGGLGETLKGKDVDELFDEARALVAKAPAVAVGTAAALGFVIARLARAGLPENGSAKTGPEA